MKMKRKKAFFSISAVAKMFSIHQQTIRLYEKEGLINPKRSAGNTRLFSEEDVNHLEEIIYLTHQLGINLAGVEMILKLKKQIHKMQRDMNKMFDQTQEELEKETEISKNAVKTSMRQLMNIKKDSSASTVERLPHSLLVEKPEKEESEEQTFDSDNWDIEYEDE